MGWLGCKVGKETSGFGHIFALMRIGAWHDEGIETGGLHPLPQRGQPACVIAATGPVVKGLKAHNSIAFITSGSITMTPGRSATSASADCSSRGKVL